MSNNPIEELRDLKVPVSEQEWDSIVHDKRYVRKFGRKAGMSPKGRAALIAGAAAVLLTVPVLISTLSHKTADPVQDSTPMVQTAAPQQESVSETTPTVLSVTASPSASSKSEETRQVLPSASTTTSRAATHEQSTLAAVTEARIPANSQPAQTNKSVNTTVLTPRPAETVGGSPKSTSSTTVSNSKKTQPDVADNRLKTANTIVDDNQPTVEKSQEEPIVEADEFFIPTAFTPNGDGLNDLFKVQANFVPNTFEMSIFNRKGELMFLSQDMGIGWDGQFHGQTLPSGVYVCIIKYTDREGKMQKKQGQVMLLP